MFGILSLVAGLLLAVYYLVVSPRQRRNLPPFPTTPLPLVGNLLSLSKNPRPIFSKWREEHGDIFSLYLGQSLVIVLNGYDVIKDALVTRGNSFSDRPPLFINEVTNYVGSGTLFSSGQNWRTQRAVSMSILRSLGMGKNVLAEKIMEEIACYLEILSEKQGKPIDLRPITQMAMSNIICAIVEGKRHEYDNVEFLSVSANMDRIAHNTGATNPLNFFPSLIHLPGDLFHGKQVTRSLNENLDFFRRRYVEQKDFVENEGEAPSSFIEAYLREKSKMDAAGKSGLDESNLVKNVFDLMAAGTETSSTTILWLLLYLIHFPEIQKKIHQEMDSEIGMQRMPSMKDKNNLPYLNATVMEVQRICSVVPLALTHATSDTVNFRGFTIPKGTSIAPNLDSVLHDPKVWGADVFSFRPERHLDDHGNLVTRDEFIPFSIGRRICLGEGLAKMELFLFSASLLQKFSVQPAQLGMLPPLKEQYGITSTPHEYEIRLVQRMV